MNISKSYKYWIYIILSVSMLINISLGIVLFSKDPFLHQKSTAQAYFIAGIIQPEYDGSTIDEDQMAVYFAQKVWEEKFGDKMTKPYHPVNGEIFDILYFKRLDCWGVTTNQTVGVLELSPYAFFDPEGKNVITFLSPLELFD